ncbi:MAG: hypothetical protein DK306_000455 [Chloroflexi bacterium]|nr:MAG: hypothetical protein DK306_000455 [Chloroflexota bacterium]
MIFKRLFKRATPAPPSLAEGLIAPLAEAGLTAVVVQGSVPEREAGLRPGVTGRGLVQVSEGGPPDFVQVTSEGGGTGHLVRAAAIGFHFLIRRDRVADSIAAGWGIGGKVVARREFGGVGMAHSFHWEAAMELSDVAAPQAVTAAEHLNRWPLPREAILKLLQDSKTLVLEVGPELLAPHGEAGVIRASIFFSGQETITAAEVELLRSICGAVASAD